MQKSIPTLVFDFGSDTIKAGIATTEEPDFIIPNCFPKGQENFNFKNPIPDDCELDYAFVNGEVANQKRVQFIFAYILQHYFPEEDPEELRVIFNETPFASKNNIKFLAETAFEDLGATEVSIKPQAVYSIAFSSLKTCICLDVGHDIAQCISQSNFYVISPAIQRSILAGHALDIFASRVLLNEENDIKTYADQKRVRQLKESLSIPLNLQDEVAKIAEDDDEALYKLTLGEVLFKPILIEEAAENPDNPQEDPLISHYMEAPTPAQLVKDCIEASDLTIRGDLWNNIIVCGGTAKMKGFRERLDKELNAIKPPNCATVQCKYLEGDLSLLTWKGAAASAKFDSKENWLSCDDYNENNETLFEKFRQFGTSFEPPKK